MTHAAPPRRSTGKRPPKKAPALKFAKYHGVATETYPPVNYLTEATVQPFDGNDTFGDCVAVGWANSRALITQVLSGSEFNAPYDLVVKLYQTQNPDFDPNGGVDSNGPGSPADGGMDIQTMLEYLVSLGADSEYGQLLGFASVDHTNLDELRAAISVFGSVLLGMIVTDTQQSEFPGAWTYDANGADPGGHCTVGGGHNDTADDYIEQWTWADENALTQAFVENAIDEAWALVWAEYTGVKEFMEQMDLATFASDYTAITGRPFPVAVTPDPAPTPEPAPAPTPDPAPVPDPTPVPPVTPPPDPPVDTPAPTITAPVDGATIVGPVTVTGTGENTDVVTLYDSGNPINVNAIPVSDGGFTTVLTLEPGDHVLSAAQRTAAGDQSDPSDDVTITVQAVPPAPPDDDADAALAHFFKYRLEHSPRLGWELYAEMKSQAKKWLKAKGL